MRRKRNAERKQRMGRSRGAKTSWRRACTLCAAQSEQRDFGRNAEAHCSANSAESAVNIEHGEGRLRMT